MLKNLTIALFLIAMFIPAIIHGQSFGIKGGLNLANIYVSAGDDYDTTFDTKVGYHIGGLVEIPLGNPFSFELGICLSTKGYTVNSDYGSFDENISYKEHLNLLYLEFPLAVKATAIVNDIKVYGSFGPCLGIGLSGSMKMELSTPLGKEVIVVDDVWAEGDSTGGYKRVDFGLTIGTGIEINHVLIGFSYSFGLINITNSDPEDFGMYHRVFAISAGYLFN